MRKASASKALVVDACIARRSAVCRPLLDAIRDICHRMAMSAETRVEWYEQEKQYAKKQRQYAQDWRLSMIARRKLVALRPVLDEGFRERAADTGRTPKARAAILKDLRLVEAASVADGIIISLDDNARDLLRAAAQSCPELRTIVWVNPEEMGEQALREWLEDGAPSRPELTLGASE